MEINQAKVVIGKDIYLHNKYDTLAATISKAFKINSICCLPNIVNNPENEVATIRKEYIRHKHLMYSPATA